MLPTVKKTKITTTSLVLLTMYNESFVSKARKKYYLKDILEMTLVWEQEEMNIGHKAENVIP